MFKLFAFLGVFVTARGIKTETYLDPIPRELAREQLATVKTDFEELKVLFSKLYRNAAEMHEHAIEISVPKPKDTKPPSEELTKKMQELVLLMRKIAKIRNKQEMMEESP